MDTNTNHPLDSAFTSPTFEHDGSFRVDKPVGSMSISPCGRDVVLASRQGLHIIDLDDPWALPRHLPHHTPWEVADVQWSPFPSRDYWVISTSNQKALVWNLAMSTSQASIEHVLHAHTRAITDINFSAHHPDVLATCAVDSFVHCWDLRHPAKPVITFADFFAGSTQVKWNRQDPHIIASSHDKFLRIWDDRKGAYPLRSIEAHDTKIYGVDWNRTRTHGVTTCSLDKTIKFWDYSNPEDEPERIIKTSFPVWRARHTPFGWGVLAMPQRGDNDLYLYDRRLKDEFGKSEEALPVHQFKGHTDQVKEFLWRPRGSIEAGIDNREFQLVTWGADRILRLHKVDEKMLKEVGYEKGKEVHKKFNLTRKDATYKTFREETGKLALAKLRSGVDLTATHPKSKSGINMHSALNDSATNASATLASTWDNGGFLTSKPGMRARHAARVDLDPIAWMQGVKIGKREVPLDGSSASILSPSVKAYRAWESFDSLGEEIAHVGAKFTKVDFHEIDVQNRFVKLSMHGPWGPNAVSTYLDCRIDFPTKYPMEVMPSLKIEKTAAVDTATMEKITNGVQEISSTYLNYQRESLEAVTRYLQGEYTVDELLAWTKDEPNASMLESRTEDDTSSSDDEDELGTFAGLQPDDSALAGSGVLSLSNSNANVPLPKACGALWADNGRLVCFFPPKEDKSQSLFGSLGLDSLSPGSKGRKRIFEGFGKLHQTSFTKPRLTTIGTVDSDDSESDSGSDDSYFSSSSSSASSKVPSQPSQFLSPSYAIQSDSQGHSRVVNPLDDTLRSNGSKSQPTSGTTNSKNVISIYNFEHLLPAKRELAQQYLYSGFDACDHNANIAKKAGSDELADVWTLLGLIVSDCVPVDAVSVEDRGLPIVLLARRTLSSLRETNSWKKTNSAIDLSFDERKKKSTQHGQSSIVWGQHPLGGSHFVKELFSHFERIADVQMLATMSCILDQPPTIKITRNLDNNVHQGVKDSGRIDTGGLHSPGTLSLSNRHYQRYFPYLEVAQSLLQPYAATKPSSILSTSGKLRTGPASLAGSFGASNSDSPTPHSTGITPPSSFRPGRRSVDRSDSSSQVMSTSPEQIRSSHRSNSNLASAFAVSFTLPFSLTASAASSPPGPLIKRSNSPTGSYAGLLTPSVTWGATSVVRKMPKSVEEPRSAGTTLDFPKDFAKTTINQVGFKINLKNQDKFDSDGYSTSPLLNPKLKWQYQANRNAYAYMLFTWGMPIARAEILKYNTNVKTTSTETDVVEKSPLITLGKKAKEINDSEFHARPVELKRNCATCTMKGTLSFTAFLAKCRSCQSAATPLSCLLCDEAIRGRSSPCLGCGHVLHTQCRSLLSPQPGMTEDSYMCISGCGCKCSEKLIVMVDWPEERPPPNSPAPSTIREKDELDEKVWYDEGHTREDVAYESLAKNLVAASKNLKPKSSRIWRGKERRTNSLMGS